MCKGNVCARETYEIVRSPEELVFSYLSEYFVKVWFGPNLINAITEVSVTSVDSRTTEQYVFFVTNLSTSIT